MASDRKLCVVCSKYFRSDLRTCPEDGAMLVLKADDGIRSSRLGHVIGNYRLLRVLGEGGVGTVYAAEHVRLGRKVALKLLHPEVVDAEVVTRFFNEARAVNEIRHANIIEVEDFVTTPTGEHYMLMELLQGEDLRTVIGREKTLDPARVTRIGEQIASALAAVHAVDIIHRDLKPDNVLVIQRDGEEMSKLLDFGVAKFADDGKGLTRDGMTMGTPRYMAPEQIIAGEHVGKGSDIYALGILMYELLTGVTPFNGSSIAAILRAHVSEAVVPPSIRRGEPLPPVLEAAVLKCLEKKIGDRFLSADELAEALRGEQPVQLTGRVTIRATTQQGRVATQPGQSARIAAQSGRSTRLPSQSGPSARVPSQSGPSARLPSQSGPSARLPSQSGPSARLPSQSGRMASRSERAASELPVAPRHPRRFVQMLPALAMAATAAVIHFWPHGEPSTANAASITPPRVATSSPANLTSAPGPTAPSEIQLSLASKPPGAQLFLGAAREPLGASPVTISLPISSEPVMLMAKFADGHEVTETVVPDGPRGQVVLERPLAKPAQRPRPAATANKPDTVKPPQTTPAGAKSDRDGTLDPFE